MAPNRQARHSDLAGLLALFPRDAALDVAKQAALESDIIELLELMNRGGRNSLVVPSTYLEAVVTKR